MKRKRRIFLWGVAGWILASLLANRVFASGLVNVAVLSEMIAGRCGNLGGESRGGWIRLFFLRTLQTGVLAGICAGRFAKAGVRAALFLTGACASATLVILTWTRGTAGILIFLCALFPQDLFYLTAWFLLIAESTEYPYPFPRPYRRRIWLIAGFLCIAGIWAELVIGKKILKIF